MVLAQEQARPVLEPASASEQVSTPLSTLEPPFFSQPAGFHTGSIELHLVHPDPEAAIYYTLDGSEPDEDSPLFETTIAIHDRSSEPNHLSLIPTNFIEGARGWSPPSDIIRKATVVRARAYHDGSWSPTVTGTFFVYPEGPDSYSLPVVSIVTDSLNLFGEEHGLYVPGVSYIQGADATGNYVQRGEEWERPASFEFFETDGTPVLNHDIGIRIHGGFTRRFPMKSLRLYSRSDYGQSRFLYPFFHDLEDENFNRLILRQSGNDFGHTMFMDAAAQSLVRHFNMDTQAYRPVIVFLNGEYWGIHNIRERYDKHYLERVYGADPENIDYLTGPGIADEGTNTHYNQLTGFVRSFDMGDPENFDEVTTLMDLDNYLDYYSAQIYYGNSDWPQNNIDFWRLRVPYDPQAPAGLDGRWRWLLYDVDRSLGYATGPDFDMIGWITSEINPVHQQRWPNQLFRGLLENQNFFHDFINKVSDHLNTAFTPERVAMVVDSLKTPLLPVIDEHIGRWVNHRSRERWDALVANMFRYAEERPGYVRQHLQDHFNTDFQIGGKQHFDIGSEASITLNVSENDHGYIRINTTDIEPRTPGVSHDTWPWSGIYFSEVPLSVEAVSRPGYEFSHWDVDTNGKIVSGATDLTEKLTGNGNEMIGLSGLATYDLENPVLHFKPQDGIVLTARFRIADEEVISEPVYFWVFTDDLPNNTPLETIRPVYTVFDSYRILESNSSFRPIMDVPAGNPDPLLVYQPAISPYPPPGTNTAGIMDRVNDPTNLNYWPDALGGLAYEESDMRGIRTRNPSLVHDPESPTSGDRESALILYLPTTGYEHPVVRFAAQRTTNGQRGIMVEYSVAGPEPQWTDAGLPVNTFTMHLVYQLITVSFEQIPEASDNPFFMVRIRFTGDEEIRRDDSGNVRFNNISLHGYPLEKGSGRDDFVFLGTEIDGGDFFRGELVYSSTRAVNLSESPGLVRMDFLVDNERYEQRLVEVPPGDTIRIGAWHEPDQTGYHIYRIEGWIPDDTTSSVLKKENTVRVRDAWPQYRMSLHNTGFRFDDPGLEDDPFVFWKWPLRSVIRSSPVIADGRVYFGAHDGRLYALEVETGEKSWSVPAGGPVVATPAISGDRVFFGSSDGFLYALDRFSGDTEWMFETGGTIRSSPIIVGDRLFFGAMLPGDDSRHGLLALDATDGTLVWSYETQGAVNTTAAFKNGILYTGSEDHYLYALDEYSASLQWRFNARAPVTTSPALSDSSVYFSAGKGSDHHLFALDSETGSSIWSRSLSAPLHDGLIVADTMLIGADKNGRVYAWHTATGEELWSQDLPVAFHGRSSTGIIPGRSAPVAAGERVYAGLGGSEGGLAALDRHDGSIVWLWDDYPVHNTPALMNGSLYVGSDYNGLMVLSSQRETQNTPEEPIHSFRLYQNYPNPFNPDTRIRYELPEAAKVRLEIYNPLGQRVAILVSANQGPGSYTAHFDASNLASGIYLYRLHAGDTVKTRKMLLLR